MSVILLLGVALVVLVLWKLCAKPPKFPPGPPRWPVVGNLLQVWTGGLMHEVAARLSSRYGEVAGFYLGSQPVVVVSGLSALKEASAREDLSGRPIGKVDKELNQGILFNYGPVWREQRRFSLRNLRDLGLGKRSMEGVIHEEVGTLLAEVARMAGPDWSQPVELHEVLGTSGINVLWHILAGQRYSHSDERLQRLIGMVKYMTATSTAAGGVVSNFPWLASLFPNMTNLKTFAKIRENIREFIREDVRKHKETLDTNSPRDFLDVYLIEMEKQSNDPNSSFTEKQLINVCRNFFSAGTDTTFNSVTFALVYMVRFPLVQKKVQDEIDRVVGRDRLPGLDDKGSLVYTEATLQEALRRSSVVPLAVPHAPLLAQQNVDFRGYVIPKDARVLLNLAHLHMDAAIWGDPENFRPERFISPEGKLLRPEALMPFGSGKRQCLGEALARNNLLLFFTAVMQRYSLLVPPGERPPSLQPLGGFTLSPQPFRAIIQPRFAAA